MFVDSVPNRGARPTILLRESWREGPKVRKRTLANLSSWPPAKVRALRLLLKNKSLVSADDVFSVVRSLPHGHVELVLAACRRLRLPALLDRAASRQRDCVLAMIAQRLLKPSSKLASAGLLRCSTLAQEMHIEDADEDDLDDAMDWLLKRQQRIEKRLAKRHLQDDAQVLYDAFGSYYEGRAYTSPQSGHTRDGKRGRTVPVYGVLADRRGRPVAVRAFAGGSDDPATVADQVHILRESFGLQRLVLVGERGMLTDTEIETLRRDSSLSWISALSHDQIRRLATEGSVRTSLFDERNLAEIHSPLYPNERLVVCCNRAVAARCRRTRDELLGATEEAFERIQREVRRRTKKPLTAAEIAEKVGRAKQRVGVGEHFETVIADNRFEYSRNHTTIDREAELDGLYGFRTSQAGVPSADVVRSYKNLARVERAFRCRETVDLMGCSTRHSSETRVRAHEFLCLLAHYVEWHLRQALAELLLQEEGVEGGQAQCDAVAPAEPTAQAQAKKNRRTTKDGLEVHSFETLMEVLATRCRYQCRVSGDAEGPLLERLTAPTPLHQRALELVRSIPVDDWSSSKRVPS